MTCTTISPNELTGLWVIPFEMGQMTKTFPGDHLQIA